MSYMSNVLPIEVQYILILWKSNNWEQIQGGTTEAEKPRQRVGIADRKVFARIYKIDKTSYKV